MDGITLEALAEIDSEFDDNFGVLQKSCTHKKPKRLPSRMECSPQYVFQRVKMLEIYPVDTKNLNRSVTHCDGTIRTIMGVEATSPTNLKKARDGRSKNNV